MYKGQKTFIAQASSAGIAEGKIFRVSKETTPLSSIPIASHEIKQEQDRLRKACAQAIAQIRRLQTRFRHLHSLDHMQILESYRMVLEDKSLLEQAGRWVQEHFCNAENALTNTLRHFQTFERREDFTAIVERLLKNLRGEEETSHLNIPPGRWILLAKELSPADVILLPRDRVVGFATDVGGKTSHTLITACSLDFPALVGLHSAFDQLEHKTPAILDGYQNELVLSPTLLQKKKYQELSCKYQSLEKLLLKDNHLPAVTLDGQLISLEANVEFLEELPTVLKHGAEGIGLFRTEQLYLGRNDLPSEEEQFQVYKTLLQKMAGRPVTIRLFDLSGAEWLSQMTATPLQENFQPALGLRGIRFALQNPDLLKTQLSALLRASTYGNLKVLIPFVSKLEELLAVQQMMYELKRELKKKKAVSEKHIPIGVTIEVPSAVLIADILAKHCDFFSIGSNDLLQYELAMDRNDEATASLLNPLHPAILRCFQQICHAAQNAKIPVTLCGELAGDPDYLPLLLGLPLKTLSMNALMIPRIRKLIRERKKKEAKEEFGRLLKLDKSWEIEQQYKAWAHQKATRKPLDTTTIP